MNNDGQNKVTLLVYDISNGMAKSFSPMFLGKVIEGIYHTSIVVYGREYFYGGGICNAFPKVNILFLCLSLLPMVTQSKKLI